MVRRAAMTVHTPMPADSHLLVEASARWRGGASKAAHLSRALTGGCVTETSSRAKLRDFAWHDDGRFEFTVVPSFDKADRRQLRGCMSDLRMPKLLVSVLHMQSVVPVDTGR